VNKNIEKWKCNWN